MAEWLRPGLWEVLTIKLRGIEPGQVLITKKPTGEGLRSLVTVAGIDQMFRWSGWPSVSGRGFGRYSRLGCVGSNLAQILITKKPTGESGAKVTSS